MKKTKKINFLPITLIFYLKDAFNYYIDMADTERDKEILRQAYLELLHAYHVYAGIKKDYRKKQS